MKYTLITGASRGIGRACALKLCSQGHHLILTANKDAEGLAMTKELALGAVPGLSSDCIRTYLSDASDPDQVRSLMAQLKKDDIRINVLVNNAGIAHFQLIQDMTDEEWNHVISTNLHSVFYMCRAVIPDMVHDHFGRIINISSYWGIKGSAMESAYAASKGAVNAFTLSLADELLLSGIQVNAIAAEYVDTSMNRQFTGEEIRDILEEMPSGRITSPEEIAGMVGLLAQKENGINGRILLLDDLKK